MSDKDNLLDALVKLRMEREKPDATSFSALAATLFPASASVTQRQWFNRQTLYIDGHTFEDCKFDGCHLVTEYATFAFRKCAISPDCRIYFKGVARKIARLLMHMLRVQGRVTFSQDEAGIFAVIHEDGTFSLE